METETVKLVLNKFKNKNGFTLAETLITVLILLMVSGIVAGGVPAAANAYIKAVDAANAHVLLSTTVNALRDEFSTAWDVSQDGSGAIMYYSSDTGSQSRITVENGVIMLQEYVIDELLDDAKTVARRPIVSEATTIHGKLSVICSGITYEKTKSLVTVTGLQVNKKSSDSSGTGTVIVKMPEQGLQIRVLTREATS